MEANAHIAETAVQAQVDALRAGRAKAEVRQANVAGAAATASATTAAAGPPFSLAASGEMVPTTDALLWQNQVASELLCIDTKIHRA